METIGNTRLQIIQGDSFDRIISIEGAEKSQIEGVYFSCEKLEICKKLVYDESNNYYVLSLNASETSDFKTIETTYDLTIKFTNDKTQTATYCSQITIMPKVNKVNCFE